MGVNDVEADRLRTGPRSPGASAAGGSLGWKAAVVCGRCCAVIVLFHWAVLSHGSAIKRVVRRLSFRSLLLSTLSLYCPRITVIRYLSS